ncbi:pyridoxal phosphate-dependent aminotransferase [Beijerinckia indica]|uniref:aspartate transaminase n=1 Tax=Beijerinckia indica subsp. indica (strain ATCC 9039 / DSM 1715 / NCIMB 8712) TaxID=395963 RepID=B2IC36_BEII9|nr:aminotransferase class I/II-fold pyridoxal phosphate-dependent enzyme [Beijerinckia indica]ACB95291.1 aminotransferase class I and II [Beijerinckia indica subsp. indica ATCC 9039]
MMTGLRERISSTRSAMAPFLALDILNQATQREREGENIVHMEVGEPGATTPTVVRQAVQEALAIGRVGYTEALGRPSLRARIARHYQETYGVTIAPERVAVTIGSSGGFMLAFLAAFDAGARIGVQAPGYPAYRNIFDALGLETVVIETNASTRHVVTPDMIEAAHAERPLDGLLLMSPANPTGTMMSPEDLQAVCAVCDRLGITFISDEVYHGLTYLEPAETALKFSDRVIVANSFSKYYCMTGWRVGWLILPEALMRPVERLQQNLAISVPYLSQVAAEAAFDAKDELQLIKAGYAANRSFLLRSLPQVGLADFHPVDGAFYIYADVSRFTNDSLEFSRRMLDETGVAVTPGLDFDRNRGNSFIRLSFAGPERDMVEAVSRLGLWLPS